MKNCGIERCHKKLCKIDLGMKTFELAMVIGSRDHGITKKLGFVKSCNTVTITLCRFFFEIYT